MVFPRRWKELESPACQSSDREELEGQMEAWRGRGRSRRVVVRRIHQGGQTLDMGSACRRPHVPSVDSRTKGAENVRPPHPSQHLPGLSENSPPELSCELRESSCVWLRPHPCLLRAGHRRGKMQPA